MTKYAILAKLAWDHATPLHECEDALIVPQERLTRTVADLTGRAHVLSYDSARRKLRAGNRLYVAPRPGFKRGGILVQQVPAS